MATCLEISVQLAPDTSPCASAFVNVGAAQRKILDWLRMICVRLALLESVRYHTALRDFVETFGVRRKNLMLDGLGCGLMRKPTAILHIGLEKTGTTSIQDFLFRNRLALLDRGITVPLLPTSSHHHEICLMGQSDQPHFLTLRSITGTIEPSELQRRRRLVAEAVAAAVASSDGRTFVFSSELLHSNLIDSAETDRLQQFLARYFDEVKVVVYLRRQDRLAVSLFSSRIGGGELIASDRPLAKAIFDYNMVELPYYFKYNEVLKRYAASFGRNNMIIRLFERQRLASGDAVRDFCAACSIPAEGLDFTAPSNESLTPAVLMMLMALNAWVPLEVDGTPNPLRVRLMFALERHFSGGGKLLGREEAKEIVSICQYSNQDLAAFMGMAGQTPFDDSFEDYPESPPNLSRLATEHAEIIAKLLAAQSE